MQVARVITYILFPIFLGMTIGGAAGGNGGLLACGIVFLLLDIVVGVSLQGSIERKANNDNWNNLTYEQKREKAHNAVEQAKQDLRDQGVDVDDRTEKCCDDFNRENKLGEYAECTSIEDELFDMFDEIYSSLEIYGGAIFTGCMMADEAEAFLNYVCENMPYAPYVHTHMLFLVSIENLDGEPAILYSFKYPSNGICQNVFIFLVRTKEGKIRLFTVETSFNGFVLCEYADGCHKNYSSVELENVPTRIKEILAKA